MSQKQATLSEIYEKIKKQVKVNTPIGVIDAIVCQIERVNEAKKRIEDEGIVVRDMKGSVISHPAIKIEIEANKIICELLERWKSSTYRNDE